MVFIILFGEGLSILCLEVSLAVTKFKRRFCPLPSEEGYGFDVVFVLRLGGVVLGTHANDHIVFSAFFIG